MDENNILNLSAKQIVAAIKNNQITAEDVLSSYLNQISKINPTVNAIIQLNQQAALDEARAIDLNISCNTTLREKKLLGVPITIKNACHVKRFQPDKGCTALVGETSTYDATVVSRLRKEGAIILGLTNTPEFSIGFETENDVYGRTYNPHCLSKTPGGSSGGEAAAIAAYCSCVGIGSDATGSLKIPAHFCGVSSLKLTQGRVPLSGSIPIDCMGLFSQFISFGPIARHVDDLDLLGRTISGSDNIDPHVPPVGSWSEYDNIDLSTLKIAYYTDDGVSKVTSDTVDSVEIAINTLQQLGVSIEYKCPDKLNDLVETLSNSIFWGGDKGEWIRQIYNKLGIPSPSPLMAEFMKIAEKSDLNVTKLRNDWIIFDKFRQDMLRFINSYDAIICPVAATPAKNHGKTYQEIADFSYSIIYSLVNFPIVTVPVHVSSADLPIALQVIAKPWREDVALALAKKIETLYIKKQPEVFQSIIKKMGNLYKNAQDTQLVS